MKGIKQKFAASVCAMAVSLAALNVQAQSNYRLNDDINFSLDTSGNLTVNSGYLTYYLLRGYDPKSGYQTGRHLISASSQSIDFDVADLELDGFLPKVDFKRPKRNYEATELKLSEVIPSHIGWQNADLNLRGISLVGLTTEFTESEKMAGEDFADMLALFALNTLVVVDIAANTVTGGPTSTAQKRNLYQQSLDKFAAFAEYVRQAREQRFWNKYQQYIDYAKLSRDVIDTFVSAAGVNPADYPWLEYALHDSEMIFTGLEKLQVITGEVDDASPLKGTLKQQYQKLLKADIDAGKVQGDSFDALIQFSAQRFKDSIAGADADTVEIMIAKYMMEPLGQALALYQKGLRQQLIVAKAKGQQAKVTSLETQIKDLNQARVVILLSSLVLNSGNIYQDLKEDPQKFISTIFELGVEASAEVAEQVFEGEDGATVLAKYALQRMTGSDGRSRIFHVTRKLNQGFSIGNSIANKLLPFIWDLAWAPGKMSISLVEGKLNPLGAMQTRVDVYRVAQDGSRELLKQLSSTDVLKDTVLALDHLDQLDIEVALSRSNMFDETRSPWLMSRNVPPQRLYEAKVLDTNARGYATRFLCTRNLLNDLEYVDYNISSTSTADAHKSRCGAGDWYANTWFNGTKAGATIYEDNDKLANSLKLKPELSDAQALISYQHIYREGDKPILVLVDGHSTNAITHKISFVPAVKNVGFDTVQMPVDQGGYVVGFDVEQILQSNLDPIVTYRWDFGDGSEVLETSSALVEHVYAEGNFTVTLTVVTQAGIETTVSQAVEVGERLRTPILEKPRYQIETDGSASITLNWRNIEQGSAVNLYLAEESFNDLNDIANYASLKGAMRVQATGILEYRFTGLAADTEYFMVATTQGTHKESPLSNQVQLVTREVAQPTGKLNDTGIDWCADGRQDNLDCPVQGYEGQDGDHGRDALARKGQLQKIGGGAAGFDFTKLDNSGNPLPETASEWSCVRDNVTGLIWEVKQPAGSAGLRDANHTYTWYNPDNSTNGGSAGTQNGGTCQGSDCDTAAFINAVNSQGLCGASDWRLPSVNELLSIVHNGRVEPVIDQSYFPHTPQYSWYWSSSPDAYGSGYAWGVNFGSGYVDDNGKDYSRRVRLVRAGQ
ncbi:TPA: DUF1566 domain-containing protein [Vibrio cholerae]|nr:DUF1566 domain-containing protein [Vibrio cholerae]HCJ7280390.1 DUF1566 domain-containing protein [Vibrio cholerae]HCJ7316293.1 DUF1566 domain-containing protein [Vibrio cholerae]